jgi:hypothetical protein
MQALKLFVMLINYPVQISVGVLYIEIHPCNQSVKTFVKIALYNQTFEPDPFNFAIGIYRKQPVDIVDVELCKCFFNDNIIRYNTLIGYSIRPKSFFAY